MMSAEGAALSVFVVTGAEFIWTAGCIEAAEAIRTGVVAAGAVGLCGRARDGTTGVVTGATTAGAGTTAPG